MNLRVVQRPYLIHGPLIGSPKMVVVHLDEGWPPTGEKGEKSAADSNDAPDADVAMLIMFNGDGSNLREAYEKLWRLV